MGKPKKKGSKKSMKPAKVKEEDEFPEDLMNPSASSGRYGVLTTALAIAVIAVFVVFWQPESAFKKNPVIEDKKKNATLERKRKVADEKPADDLITELAEDEVSIAVFHDIDDYSSQTEKLVKYIQYDDGYTTCLGKEYLTTDKNGVWELKMAKLEYLERIADSRDHWVFHLPKDKSSLNVEKIESTCRIMTLTHEDFDGVDALHNVLKSFNVVDFVLPKQSNASEYRTHACLARITDEAVKEGVQTNTPELRNLRQAWFRIGSQAKEAALAEPTLRLQYGWAEHRKSPEEYSYYIRLATKKSTWIRPTARPGEGAEGPEWEKKASLIARAKPCDWELQLALLE